MPKEVTNDSVHSAFQLYTECSNHRQAIREFCGKLKGVISSISFRKNKMGLAESTTVAFPDGGEVRVTHLITLNDTQTKLTRVG